MSSDLGAKTLAHLLRQHLNHTNPRVKHQGGLRFKVIADLYHDCDRAPSYTTEDDVLTSLDRMEAEMLVGLLKAQSSGQRV